MADSKPCWSLDDYKEWIPLRGFIREYLDYATLCTDAHPKYHVMAIAPIVANAVAAEHDLVVDNEPIPLHDFFLIVGSSGTRKSAAIKRAIRTFQPCYEQHKLEHRIWFPESCTPEGIMDALSVDPNRIMVLSEWTELQSQVHANYWKHTPQFFELIFDRMPVHRLKMSQNVKIDRPALTIIGGSTPSLIKQHTSSNDWEAGKLARYIICPAEKPQGKEMVNAVEHPELLPALRERFLGMVYPQPAINFMVSREAKEIKDDWQYSQEWQKFAAGLPPHLQPSANRAGDHVYRLAAIYQASIDFPWEYQITAEAIIPAIQFVWECMLSTAETFGVLPMHDKSPLFRLRTVLSLAGSKGITKKVLLRKLHMYKTEFNRAIETLQECGEVSIVKAKDDYLYTYVTP